MKLPRPLRVALAMPLIVLATVTTARAQAQVLVNDSFASATINNNVVASVTTWERNGNNGTLSLQGESGAGTLDSSDVLQYAPGGGFNTVRGHIPVPSPNPVPGATTVDMGSGDILTVVIDLRITSSPINALVDGLRIGLGSAAGTYGFQIGTGGTTGAQFRRFTDGAIAHGPNTLLTTTGTPRSIGNNTPGTFTFTVKRASHTTVELTMKLVHAGQTTTWTAADTDANALLSNFDKIIVSQGNSTMTIRLDDAVVTYTPRTLEGRTLARWKFDEPPLTGIDAQVYAWDDTIYHNELQLRQGGAIADRHTDSGTGVSGRPHDRALLADGRGIAENPQINGLWQNRAQITFAGWVKINSVPATGVHLLDWPGASGVKLWFSAPGKLTLRIGADTATPADFTTTDPILTSNHVGNWVYLAVTYRGNTGNGVKFYRATTITDVGVIDAPLGNTTAIGNIRNTGPGDLHLGSDRNGASKFPGQIDDFMVHERELTLTNLRSFRLSGRNPNDASPNDFPPQERVLNGKFTIREGFTDRGDGWGNDTYGAVANHSYHTTPGDCHSPGGVQRFQVTAITPDNSSSASRLVQDVMLKAGKIYKASVWLRSKPTDEEPYRGGKIRFHLRKKFAYFTPYATRTIDLIPDGQWREYTVTGGTYHDAVAYFAIEFLSTGTVWIDDASLVEIDAPIGVREELDGVKNTPVPGRFFGIHLNQLSGNNTPTTAYHPFWPALGQKTLRLWDTKTRWGDIEIEQNTFDYWDRFDLYVNRGVTGSPDTSIIYTLGMPPTWAVVPDPKHMLYSNVFESPNKVSSGPPNVGSNWANWTSYISKVRDHANGRIKYWEIWNEANVKGSNDENDPTAYSGTIPQMVELAHAAAAVLKTDSSNKILSPNVTVSGWQWFEQYMNEARSRGPAYLDVPDIYSFHAYGGRIPENRRVFTASFRDILSRYPTEAGKPIWNTEGSERVTDAPIEEKAGIVSRSYITQWINGVSNYTWYTWEGSGTGIPIAQKIGGVYSTVPPPAGIAYRETASWLVGAKVVAKTVTPTSAGTERWVVEITRPGTYKGYIIWDTAIGSPYNWTIPSSWNPAPVRKRTLNGTATAFSGNTVAIGNAPILLESGDIKIEAEHLVVYDSSDDDLIGSPSDTSLSGGAGASYNATVVNDYITYIMPNVGIGSYKVYAGVKRWTNRGIFKLEIADWKPLPAPTFPSPLATGVDTRNSSADYVELPLGGTWTITTTGDKLFKFTVTGTSGTGYVLLFDYIRLERQ